MRGFGRRLREAKSVRAFAFEVAIVVVGVLIALGAQQMVEDWTWRQKVAATETGMREELKFTSLALIEQMVTAPCVLAQIDEARARVLDRSGPFRPLPIVESAIGRHTIRAPSRNLSIDSWTGAVGDGTIYRMDPRRRAALTQFYVRADLLTRTMEASELQRSRLLVLGDRFDFDGPSRYNVLRDLSELRAEVSAQLLVSGQMMATLRDIGWMPDRSTIAEIERGLASPKGTSAVCRARTLPLGDWRKQLAAIPPEY